MGISSLSSNVHEGYMYYYLWGCGELSIGGGGGGLALGEVEYMQSEEEGTRGGIFLLSVHIIQDLSGHPDSVTQKPESAVTV